MLHPVSRSKALAYHCLIGVTIDRLAPWWMGVEAGGKYFHLNFGVSGMGGCVSICPTKVKKTHGGKVTTGKNHWREWMPDNRTPKLASAQSLRTLRRLAFYWLEDRFVRTVSYRDCYRRRRFGAKLAGRNRRPAQPTALITKDRPVSITNVGIVGCS